jgi:glycosyltransferase involved in cell wall biosynthesis
MLVYDIYPDTLVTCGLLKESGLVTRLWRRMNRLAWENAEIVFTIGNRMAKNLERRFDVTKTATKGVVTIHNWADTEWIRPMAKADNEFAKKHGQVGKLTVMYSGNLGHTHDIETILAAARELNKCNSIHFMIIGEGAKRRMVEESKLENNLKNLTILPFQPESVLPISLSTADIAIITLDRGSEGLSVPSKTHYCMAAGSALLGICDENSEIAQMIARYDCGLFVKPGDKDGAVNNILNLLQNKSKLGYYRTNSRKAAQENHSRKNTHSYIDALSGAALVP